jgi:transcription antitermination protein NusB
MSTRRRAREVVIQLLYENDLNPDQKREAADDFLQRRLAGNRPLIQFARNLLTESMRRRREIDKTIGAKAANWSVRRMAAIDRNILRLGSFELLYTDTPGRVVINEAIEIAKRYGDRQSSQFVNGILDRILHDKSITAEQPGTAIASASGE